MLECLKINIKIIKNIKVIKTDNIKLWEKLIKKVRMLQIHFGWKRNCQKETRQFIKNMHEEKLVCKNKTLNLCHKKPPTKMTPDSLNVILVTKIYTM